jgi:hypothetical protein
MSGSSGGGGGFDNPQENCADLVIDTQLSSPKDDVVNHVEVGMALDMAIQTKGTTTVVVVLYKGRVAGGIASPLVQRLRECINAGTKYRATVIAKTDGQVRVRVTAV